MFLWIALHFAGTICRIIDLMTEPFDVLTVRELRTRTGDLMRDAEEGKLSIITKHGRPAILAGTVRRSPAVVRCALRALAIRLFAAEQLTLAQAARMAEIPVELFLETLSQAAVPAVRYDPEELVEEVEIAG